MRDLHAAQFRCVQDMDRVTDEELLMLAQMPIVLLSLQCVEQSWAIRSGSVFGMPERAASFLRQTELDEPAFIDGIGLVAQ